MDETMLWFRWVEPELAKLVWARAEGMPWKPICWRFGIARATAHRRWECGLSVIVWRLNGREPHPRWGRKFVVGRVRQR